MNKTVYFGNKNIICQYEEASLSQEAILGIDRASRIFADIMNNIYSSDAIVPCLVVLSDDSTLTESLFCAIRKDPTLETNIYALGLMTKDLIRPEASFVINLDTRQFFDLNESKKKNPAIFMQMLTRCSILSVQDEYINTALAGSWNNCQLLRTTRQPSQKIFTKLVML